MRSTPIALFPREDLEGWLGLATPPDLEGLDAGAMQVLECLRQRGALFARELASSARLLPAYVDRALGDLLARGCVTCDSFGGLRLLFTPPSRRRREGTALGRWSVLPRGAGSGFDAEPLARRLLERTGVVFRRTLLRERIPTPWRDLVRALRHMELTGEVRGGRFVAGFDGEQYALPRAVVLLRDSRRQVGKAAEISAADPLNYLGILTPEGRVSPHRRRRVSVG